MALNVQVLEVKEENDPDNPGKVQVTVKGRYIDGGAEVTTVYPACDPFALYDDILLGADAEDIEYIDALFTP